LKSFSGIKFNGNLQDYFHADTFREILLARRFLRERVVERRGDALVAACLLHVLHGNRPYALSRRSHPITPFAPSGPAEYKSLIRALRDKLARTTADALPLGFKEGEAIKQDATEDWPSRVDQLDAIITSPPFFDSTRFYLANWMRLWFAGWDLADFKVAPQRFVDERQKLSFDVYAPMLRQARERLKPGAPLVIHVGRSRKCDMAGALVRVAAPWFRLHDRYVESVRDCESHGIRDKGTVTEHEILVLV
jgi:hypothetical protein